MIEHTRGNDSADTNALQRGCKWVHEEVGALVQQYRSDAEFRGRALLTGAMGLGCVGLLALGQAGERAQEMTYHHPFEVLTPTGTDDGSYTFSNNGYPHSCVYAVDGEGNPASLTIDGQRYAPTDKHIPFPGNGASDRNNQYVFNHHLVPHRFEYITEPQTGDTLGISLDEQLFVLQGSSVQ